jgi:hypothetical protein
MALARAADGGQHAAIATPPQRLAMLLTNLLRQHPAAIIDIVRQTPPWVGALLAALVWLGLSATRDRAVPVARLLLMPVVMGALALWGVVSAFGAGGQVSALLALWAACCAALLAVGARLPPPAGARWHAAAQRFHLPGSWLPLALILAVFLLKYAIGVQLALAPALARDSGFALAVAALYGLLSGLFAARTLRVLRLRGSAAATARA